MEKGPTMIHESVLDKSMNRLLATFGRSAVVRPPATMAEVAELEAVVGSLPRDLVFFLTTCNGLRLEGKSAPPERSLWSIHDMFRAIRDPNEPTLPSGLVPVLGEGKHCCDAVAVAGPARGAVVRWDASAVGACLLASSFGHYFDRWVRYATMVFESRGGRRTVRFDPAFVQADDAGGARLRDDPGVRQWLHELDLAVPCGDDFE